MFHLLIFHTFTQSKQGKRTKQPPNISAGRSSGRLNVSTTVFCAVLTLSFQAVSQESVRLNEVCRPWIIYRRGKCNRAGVTQCTCSSGWMVCCDFLLHFRLDIFFIIIKVAVCIKLSRAFWKFLVLGCTHATDAFPSRLLGVNCLQMQNITAAYTTFINETDQRWSTKSPIKRDKIRSLRVSWLM